MKSFVSIGILSISLFLSVGSLQKIRAQTITYHDVEPIFLAKCATCHRPGESAPFPLTTYSEVARRASFIRAVIERNYMPPWKADDHYTAFANNRSLTESEKNLVLRWIDAKAPQGPVQKSAEIEARQKLLSTTSWRRQPDLSLRIDAPFLVKGDNTEKFIVYKIPFEFTGTHDIEAIEFYCNNKKIIHHVNYGVYAVSDSATDIFGGARVFNTAEADRKTPDPFTPLQKNMVYYTGWIPGSGVESYPKGFGWSLPKRGVLILTAHYSAIAADTSSLLGVNLFFARSPVQRAVQVISLGSGGVGENDIDPPFFIPAGKVRTFDLKVKTQDEQSLFYVWPHMHLIGKEFTAFAVTPAGDTIPLVHIPHWDFRWQELYRLKHPVHIPAGSVINLHCTYDNTAENPFNPNNPPKGMLSVGDMRSDNEMMTLLFIYTPYRQGDEKIDLDP